MGFEQLAALKEQLALQAKQAAPAPKKSPKAGAARPPAKTKSRPAEITDPVILAISRLQRKFPAAFPKNPAPKLPLKLGIHKDLFLHAKELDLGEAEIRLAIKTWCEGRRYWTCMVEAAPRIDLQGVANGAVTAEEAARAKSLASRAGRKAYASRKQTAAKSTGDAAPAAAATQPEAPAVAETPTGQDAPTAGE